MTKVMNNSIFRSMMRIIMIVLYYHQHKTACCTELNERERAWFVERLID